MSLPTTSSSKHVAEAVDWLYSLIPLLEFDDVAVRASDQPSAWSHALPDFALQGARERDALVAALVLSGAGGDVDVFRPPVPDSLSASEEDDFARRASGMWLECAGRAVVTGVCLRLVQTKAIPDAARASLAHDAEDVEKNVGSILAEGSQWDPTLRVAINALSSRPTRDGLDSRYASLDDASSALARGLAKFEQVLTSRFVAAPLVVVGVAPTAGSSSRT